MTKKVIEKKKRGRPPKVSGTNKYDFSEKKIETLASKFWTYSEIAAFYDVDPSTIRKRFPKLCEKGREKGKSKLRDLQLAAAMKGNVSMLIWLGKQYLDQKEPEKKIIEEPPEIPDFENMSNDELTKYIDARKN